MIVADGSNAATRWLKMRAYIALLMAKMYPDNLWHLDEWVAGVGEL